MPVFSAGFTCVGTLPSAENCRGSFTSAEDDLLVALFLKMNSSLHLFL